MEKFRLFVEADCFAPVCKVRYVPRSIQIARTLAIQGCLITNFGRPVKIFCSRLNFEVGHSIRPHELGQKTAQCGSGAVDQGLGKEKLSWSAAMRLSKRLLRQISSTICKASQLAATLLASVLACITAA